MNGKNISQTPKNPDNNRIIEEAAKKLEKFEKCQKRAEKYFQDRERFEKVLGKMETNLKEKIQLDKKIKMGLNETTLEKIQMLLKSLSTLDVDILKHFSEKQMSVNKEIQTDQDEAKALRDNFNNLEKENEKMKHKINKYKSEIENLASEANSLRDINTKLQKENADLKESLEETSKVKNKLEIKIKEENKKTELLNSEIKKNEDIIKEYHEMKSLMAEKFQVEREKLEIEEKRKKNILEFFRGDIKVLVYLKVFDQVTEFLTPRDIYNVKSSNSTLRNEIERNPKCMKHNYENIIRQMNRKIRELNTFDIKKEYLTQDNEIEKLITKYIILN
jgi:chromosome segregation ATPase